MSKIKIELNHVFYQFPNTKNPVFNNLNISLEDDMAINTSHLYGIIGPSGVGKTTLLSVLGGQLKPDKGTVFINSVDIYDIYDSDRRDIIAYQMQTSTNIRGNVKTNLIFGIYNGTIDKTETNSTINSISDEHLIELLKRVGLWAIFEEKDGLNTVIGEGGLNLSGGQRQRLNFASLFLRAKHYKPVVILIDEPTASLDEISEIEITKLINELSLSAVVLVVAHRLVTIANAKGMLDMSNLNLELIHPQTKQELLISSKYFQDLQSHKLELD